MTDTLYEQTEWNMTNHAPDSEKVVAIEEVRNYFKQAAHTVIGLVPSSREQSLALTKLEEALMWAVAGIARQREGVTNG